MQEAAKQPQGSLGPYVLSETTVLHPLLNSNRHLRLSQLT